MYKKQTRKILCPICENKMKRTYNRISEDTYRCTKCQKNNIKLDIDIRNLPNWESNKTQKDDMVRYNMEIVKNDIVIFVNAKDDIANGTSIVYKDGTKKQETYTKITIMPNNNGLYMWNKKQVKCIDGMMSVKETMNKMDTILLLWESK